MKQHFHSSKCPAFIPQQNASHHWQFRSWFLYSCDVFQVIINSFCFWKILLLSFLQFIVKTIESLSDLGLTNTYSTGHSPEHCFFLTTFCLRLFQHHCVNTLLNISSTLRDTFLVVNLVNKESESEHPSKHHCVCTLLNITMSTPF